MTPGLSGSDGAGGSAGSGGSAGLTAVWSRPESERAGTPLVVALHGRGSDERSMLELASVLPGHATLVAPRAPVVLGPGAFTWFENRGIGRPVEASIKATVALFLEWLDVASHAHTSVTLLGFSGGTAMAGGLLFSAPERFAGAVLLSGTLPWDAGFDTSAGRLAGVPIFWGLDSADPVIPRDLILRSEEWLRTASGALLTEHDYPGMGHGISAAEAQDIAAFLGAHAA